MSTPNRNTIKKYSIILGITFLLFYGAFLRIYSISTQPYWMDEGYTINAVLSYAEGNMSGIAAVLDSGSTYECFLYCYPTALIANTFGFEASSYRILAVVFGLLSIYVIYLLSRKLFTLPVALLSTFFMTFGYFQIAWSTQARWYTMFTFFFWFAILSFIHARTSSSKKILWIILAIVSTLLTVFSQKIGILLPLLFAGYIVFENIKSKSSHLKPILYTTLSLVVVGVLDTFIGHNIALNFIKRITFNYNLPYYLSFFIREYLILIPFAIYALFDSNRYTKLLAIIFALYLIPLAFLTNIVHYRYMFHVTPVLYILASLGFFQILKEIKWNHKYKTHIGVILISTAFFYSNAGVLLPQTHYMLESDNPETLSERPSYAYTPQPDWNSAYAFIKENKQDTDLIISSHPHFNKIFLNEPGYWIKYDYLGLDARSQYSKDDKEFYVGAHIIDDIQELESIVSTSHGYIIFDYMAIDGKIPEETVSYIARYFEPVFHKKENEYSQVWVFKF